MSTEGTTKFDTGAVRSSDANSVALWLFSPIAMARLAYCAINYGFSHSSNPVEYVENSLLAIYEYLKGYREPHLLETASLEIFCAIEVIKNKKLTFLDINESNGYSNIPIEGIMAVARAYKEGEKKYCAYNCELGFPVHDLLNHCLLHLYKFLQNDMTEDQLGHAGWNLVMAMHSETLWPEINKGFLRGPNCSLTEDIRKRIDEEMRKKKNEK